MEWMLTMGDTWDPGVFDCWLLRFVVRLHLPDVSMNSAPFKSDQDFLSDLDLSPLCLSTTLVQRPLPSGPYPSF